VLTEAAGRQQDQPVGEGQGQGVSSGRHVGLPEQQWEGEVGNVAVREQVVQYFRQQCRAVQCSTPRPGLGSRKGSLLSLKDLVLRRSSSRRDLVTTVGEGLRQHYTKTLRPFEESHSFHTLHGPPLEVRSLEGGGSYSRPQDADFTAKPSVLLVGQYSTGKTTLIKYLLGEDFPGCRIGPEPTSDKFHVLMAAEEDDDERAGSVVPGNALVVDPKLPFRPLAK
jgi:hypothetical protein